MLEPTAAEALAPESPVVAGDMLDLAFTLHGHELPRAHRAALAAALAGALPWLGATPRAAVHRLNLVATGGATALLSARTRLTLRLPRQRLEDAEALCGTTLDIAGHPLRVGTARPRELLAFGTLYAHFVAADGAAAEGDEAAFLRAAQAELDMMQVSARAICGRHQRLEGGTLGGYALMLDHLDAVDSRRVLERGLGPHRLWGCGVFVPHKSAAAVGMPD